MVDASALTAIEPLPQGDWLEKTREALNGTNLQIEVRRSELLVWDDRLRQGNLFYSDACSLRRIWLAPGRAALGVTAKRLYFVNAGTKIDQRAEWEILSAFNQRPKSPSPDQLAKSQWAILDVLRDKLETRPGPVVLTPVGRRRRGGRYAGPSL